MLGSAGRWAMVGRRLLVVTVLVLGALPAWAADVVFPVLVLLCALFVGFFARSVFLPLVKLLDGPK